ncbi:MAG: DNA repair exonuclease, partial [Lachnospiraceae bacterium]|nr:DNA repair exonuclease [Lachnospiraceae bacterium]
MRFIHIADTHLDASFSYLTQKQNLGELRRLEQRESLRVLIDYIKTENIPYLFIAGDFYEQEHIRLSTIQYVNNLFKEIPNTTIFISPGNHDPYIKNSYYNSFNWNPNVKIFDSNFQVCEFEDVCIYGFGFTDFTCTNFDLNNLKVKNNNKLNILVIHSSLDSSKTLDRGWNPIPLKAIENAGFDYVALGHIHKTNLEENTNIIYSGSTLSLGLDEPGNHGAISVTLDKNNFKADFIKLDNREFITEIINVSEISSTEDLLQLIHTLSNNKNNFYKFILNGKRNFVVNTNNILKLLQKENILKIKDETTSNYNLTEIASQNNLKGIFVKNMLDKINDENKE